MFKYLTVILFFLLLCPLQIFAQDEASPLIERMQKTEGIEKINLLNEIAVIYRKTDRYTSMDYARQAFLLSVENNYLPGKALAKKNEGICWFFIGSNDSATLCYLQALADFSKAGDKKGVSACYNNLGLIAQETGKYDEALKYYQLSIDMDHKLGDEIGVATTKRNIVNILIYQGYPHKALILLNEILKTNIGFNDKGEIMLTLINRAAVFDNLMKYENAENDLKEAIKIALELKDNSYEILATSNLGLVTWHQGKPEEALILLNRVLEMSDETIDGYDVMNTLWIMSEIFTSKKQYTQSNEILQKLLRVSEEMDNKRQESKVLTSLGRNLIELNEIDKAMGYLSKSLEITVRINAPYEILENYRNLAHAHAILHNFSAADSLQDLFAETYSGLFNSDSIADTRRKNKMSFGIIQTSTSSLSDWIIAFLLFALLMIVSVLTYNRNNG